MIYERALEERTRLEKEIIHLKEQLAKYPAGKIVYSQNGKYTKFYVSDGKNKEYIPRKNLLFAQSLAAKKYISARIDDCTHELMAINYYLKHHQTYVTHADDLLSESSKYRELLTPHFQPISQHLSNWMNSDYERKTDHPEQLIHVGASGNLVRSKSELIIDILLSQYHIPFRYECKLELGNFVYYPDFTIRHPKTGEIYYWEHFGMMDKADYRNSFNIKLQNYIQHGIIPSINLITTYETLSHPLQRPYVENLINYYFS